MNKEPITRSQKEKNKYCILLYINAYIWNLERQYWWTYLQGSNGDADIKKTENKLVVLEEGEGGMYGESNMETYTTLCKIDSQWEFVAWLKEFKLELCGNLQGWDGKGGSRKVQKGGDMCTLMAD